MAGHFLFTMVWAGWLCMALALLMLAWKSEQMLYSELLYLELALFMGGGYGVGVLVGIIRVRKLSRSAVAYSDLHRRKVTDIRSVLFPLLIGALIVYTILLTVLYLPYLKSGAELNAGVWHVPLYGWGLVLIPAGMLLLVGLVELLISLIVRGARLNLTPDPQQSRRLDDWLRHRLIAALTGQEFLLLSGLLAAQWRLLVQSEGITVPDWLSVIGVATWLISLVLLPVSCLFVHLFRRGLGGRLTDGSKKE